MTILIPTILLGVIALVCAVVLTLSNLFFGVKEDETAKAIRECLPGANCGACGYTGCDGYAKALADRTEEKTNLCVPGGDKTAQTIAATLGVEAEDVVEKVAYVACHGTCDATERKYDYTGLKSCIAANLVYNGDKTCTYACLGYGDCARVCPKDAIRIENGVALVDPQKCIGCGMCVRECPNHIIKLVNDTVTVVVQCSNHDKGAITRKLCTNGCIGCMKCQKACPNGAVKVENSLASIDYSLCTGCGACVEVCPVHCIHEDNFICGAH